MAQSYLSHNCSMTCLICSTALSSLMAARRRQQRVPRGWAGQRAGKGDQRHQPRILLLLQPP